MYKPRDLETAVRTCSETFPALLVTGPRQVGKSTLLERIAEPGRRVVSLDDPALRSLANSDPAYFLQLYEPPILIDEVQYAPALFPHVKIECDRRKRNGLFWLTGSQQFSMMKNVSESLAGRIAILDLLGFSIGEASGVRRTGTALDAIRSTSLPGSRPAKPGERFAAILRGSFPALFARPAPDLDRFYSSYERTYLERDVRARLDIAQEATFLRFLRVAAARTAQTVNLANLARDADVAPNTAKAWLSVLEASGLVYMLRPYSANLTSRAVKTPKMYFTDTGLACHLTGWSSPETLERGAFSGPIFETHVVVEILKSFLHLGRPAPLWFYRDRDQREIDLLIEADGLLHPVEIKKKADPTAADCASFSAIPAPLRGTGAVVCFSSTRTPLSRDVRVLNVADL